MLRLVQLSQLHMAENYNPVLEEREFWIGCRASLALAGKFEEGKKLPERGWAQETWVLSAKERGWGRGRATFGALRVPGPLRGPAAQENKKTFLFSAPLKVAPSPTTVLLRILCKRPRPQPFILCDAL
jgi:hypothetical protein